MNLITNRLELIPLSIIEFDYLLNNLTLFEKNLSIKYEGEDFQNALHHIFSKQLDLMITHPHDSIFFALWVIKKQVNQVIIGSLCFKDVPNKNGEIEIGYGINPRHQNMGFMTEAVNALCQFGYTLPGVHQIIAKTSRKNIASQKVLLKNHFILSDSSGDEYCYTHQK